LPRHHRHLRHLPDRAFRRVSRDRDDTRFTENSYLAFAIYCDEAGLTLAEGQVLAEEISDALERAAESREAYLPQEMK
jgi:hypothetical protein